MRICFVIITRVEYLDTIRLLLPSVDDVSIYYPCPEPVGPVTAVFLQCIARCIRIMRGHPRKCYRDSADDTQIHDELVFGWKYGNLCGCHSRRIRIDDGFDRTDIQRFRDYLLFIVAVFEFQFKGFVVGHSIVLYGV